MSPRAWFAKALALAGVKSAAAEGKRKNAEYLPKKFPERIMKAKY
jgi:hypothetical protein